MNCQVTNGHGRILNVCYPTKEADLKMLLDFNHIIPSIEHSRRDKIIKKVRKSVIARYLKAWDREQWIREVGLEYSGRKFFDSVLSNIINQCLVLLVWQNHRVYSAEKLCEKPDLGLQRGLGNEVLAVQE